MADPNPDILPVETVIALMTILPEDQVGGLRIARFTPAARAAILAHLPAGAAYHHGGDFEEFRWGDDHAGSVMIDQGLVEEQGVEWDRNTPLPVLHQAILLEGDFGPNAVQDHQTLLQAVTLASQDLGVVAGQGAAAPWEAQGHPTAGGKRRRKTRGGRKTRTTKKRKTLRRRK